MKLALLKEHNITKKIISNASSISLIIFIIILGIIKNQFISVQNLYNILDLSSILIITAIGISFVLELGSIDLSVEGSVALSGIVTSLLIKNIINSINLGYFALFIGILCGAFFGFIIGVLHTKFKIPSFMATLGVHFIMMGLGVVATQGEYVVITDMHIRQLAIMKIGFFPISLFFSILIIFIAWFLSNKTTYGRYVLAVGCDETIVKKLGINVSRIKLSVFTLAGTFYGIAGVLLTLKLGAGDTWSSYGYTFETISACVIGGIAVTGGVGSLWNAVVGAFIMTIFRSGMVFMGIAPRVQAGIMGLIIIITVFLTIDRSKIKVMK